MIVKKVYENVRVVELTLNREEYEIILQALQYMGNSIPFLSDSANNRKAEGMYHTLRESK